MLEMFNLSFIVYAFLACVVMGMLLSYLGIHVVGRGIVFVDLALGQISSLGVALTDVLHYGETWLPIIFTLLGAVLLSFIRIRDPRIKLEAVIGLIYAVTSAVTVLIISKTPHGEADIQEVLFGTLLAVTGEQLIYLAAVFAAIGGLHWLFHKPMYAITEKMNAGKAGHLTRKEQGWNFFFYLSIGLAIVFAVRIGGVLPVFSFLVAPAVSAILLARRPGRVVIFALLCALLCSYFGLWLSYRYDFPAGPSIVTMLGAAFALAAGYRVIRSRLIRIE